MTTKKKGRPEIKIDLEQVKTLCSYQCTAQEIAAVLKCSNNTLYRRIKEEVGMTFDEFFEANRVLGKISLRRSLFKMSEKNAQTLIFLAKNYLGLKDINHTVDEEYKEVPHVRLVGIDRGKKDK